MSQDHTVSQNAANQTSGQAGQAKGDASPGDPPLKGIRIIDLTHVLAGPFATYQLALMGAEVIRIERPAGDDFVRGHGGTAGMREAGLGASFLSQNEGKQSLALDLKSDEGRAILHRLAEGADIFCENFRPGVADRLGAGHAELAPLNPRLIHCSLSGFGPTGPLSGAPAYDHILQGISGMMAMTGTGQSGPMRVGFPIVDYVAGQAVVSALLTALLARGGRPDGQGEKVSVSMLDALLAFMGPYAIHHATTGALRGLEGNAAFSDSPFSGRFDTAEGQLVVTANTPAQAVRMAGALGRPELADSDDADAIAEALRAILAKDSADAWEARLTDAGVPAARVRTLAEMLAHPQMTHSHLMRRVAVPELEMEVDVPGLPFTHEGWDTGPLSPPPTLGRDSDRVLAELGWNAGEIADLRARGIVR